MNAGINTALLSLSLLASLPMMAFEVTDNEDAFGEEDIFGEELSVFSASKYEQKVTDAPARISIITAEEIKRYGHRSLIDVLNTLPGFQTTYDNSYSYVGTRGFALLGDYNSRVLVLVDGHRINEKIYDGAIIDNGFAVDIELIKRVEVLRGPASSLYGNNALFGVINVITKRGRDMQGLEVSVSAGQQDTQKARISYGTKMANGMEVLLSASHYQSDGDDDIYYPEFDAPETNNGIAENVDKGDASSLYANISYDEFTFTAAYQINSKTLPTGTYNTVFNDKRTISSESHAFVDIKYQHLFDNGADLNARVYYDDYYYDGAWPFDYGEEGNPVDYVVWEERAYGQWGGVEATLTRQFFETHRVTVGFEYSHSFKERQLNFDPDDVYLDINPDNHSMGLFFQDNFQLNEDVIINFGLRFDDFANTGSVVNPRVAAIWNASDDSTLKFIYGSAYRAPNSYETSFQDNGESHKLPGEQLDAETIKSYELILEQTLSTNWNMMLSGYYNKIDSLITLTLDPVDELLYFKNLNKVDAKGLELEFNGQWASGWTNSISYSYQHSKDSHGGSIANTANNMIKLNVITPSWGGFKAAIELKYEDGRPLISGGKTHSNAVSNFTITHDDILPGLDFSTSIHNLFDKHYDYPAGDDVIQDTLSQSGRVFRVRFTYHL